MLGSSQTSTPTQHFESVPTTDHTEVPVDRTSETVSSTLTETDLLSSTEILQPSEASEIKQDESDRALSLEATKVSGKLRTCTCIFFYQLHKVGHYNQFLYLLLHLIIYVLPSPHHSIRLHLTSFLFASRIDLQCLLANVAVA